MKKTDNKLNYFKHRNNTILSDERAMLAEREIVTLLTVMEKDDSGHCLNGLTILDLGCGDQFLKSAIEKRDGNYIGLDVEDLNFERDAFPLDDKSIDVAISLSVIEHLYDPSVFLGEIKRVLKHGGVVWMDTPNIHACGADFWNDPTHIHPYTKYSLKMQFEMSGFKHVIVTPNYRCKSKSHYRGKTFDFFRSRYLMPFRGTSKMPVPEWLKGGCKGLFVLARS